jgi:hypothetical protein
LSLHSDKAAELQCRFEGVNMSLAISPEQLRAILREGLERYLFSATPRFSDLGDWRSGDYV